MNSVPTLFKLEESQKAFQHIKAHFYLLQDAFIV